MPAAPGSDQSTSKKLFLCDSPDRTLRVRSSRLCHKAPKIRTLLWDQLLQAAARCTQVPGRHAETSATEVDEKGPLSHKHRAGGLVL